VICLALTAYYSIKGSIDLEKSHYYSKDHHLREAHKWLTYAALVATLAGVFLLIAGFVFFFSVGLETTAIPGIRNVPFITFLLLFTALLITTGTFHSLALSELKKSTEYNDDPWAKKAFSDAIYGIVLGFGSVFGIISLITIITVSKIYFFHHKAE